MKTKYLLPNKYKKWGWIIFIPSVIIGLITTAQNIEPSFFNLRMPAFLTEKLLGDFKIIRMIETNILGELITILIIASLIVLSFSKEKQEDEFINKTRLESLVWAVYINYAVLIASVLFIYELSFLWVLIVNMFTLLIFFISKFNWQLYKFKKQVLNEE